MDETYIGGVEPDLPGGRAQGKKVLIGVAVEVREPKGMGRCRVAPLADASAASLHQFVTDHVEPGATVVTDGWQGVQGTRQARVLPRQAQSAGRPIPWREQEIDGTVVSSVVSRGDPRVTPVAGSERRASGGCR